MGALVVGHREVGYIPIAPEHALIVADHHVTAYANLQASLRVAHSDVSCQFLGVEVPQSDIDEQAADGVRLYCLGAILRLKFGVNAHAWGHFVPIVCCEHVIYLGRIVVRAADVHDPIDEVNVGDAMDGIAFLCVMLPKGALQLLQR